MSDRTRSSQPGSHAVYPGTFDPFTAGHVNVIDRVRRLFDVVTVLIAVNGEKRPVATQEQRLVALRCQLPEGWSNVQVTTWAGLTTAFCHEQQASVIVRGVRNSTDLQHEYQLAAMNEKLGITTLLVPARPELATVSSTAARALRT
ncbi:pantetheine-phosphate adenylyltransferase [Couchioplanes caeruleus]|uniref:pantetheine-phosphate adenylyltransferase n=1 Tax=Couchioplanes caeruleus TaxID=56438 RepID=UPI00201C1649|nr:pantetheine-phosphate adenylyltransferase [Couchioplanes caeruleus]UQU64626.1 pantetheine-phosphate adenylyltransferase [Couchioplanes caeruleus]